MIAADIAIPLFLTLFPLTVSPGPANLLLASSITSFGIHKTVPFLLGIYLVFALQSLVVGIGLAEIAFRYSPALRLFQYGGAAFLVYLAYHFFKASALEGEKRARKSLGFREGAILEALNFKAFAVQVTMFSLFLDPAQPLGQQVLALTLFLLVIGGASGLIWVVGGELPGRVVRTQQGAIWQGRVLGTMLLLVAVWMVVRA